MLNSLNLNSNVFFANSSPITNNCVSLPNLTREYAIFVALPPIISLCSIPLILPPPTDALYFVCFTNSSKSPTLTILSIKTSASVVDLIPLNIVCNLLCGNLSQYI